MKFYAHPCEPSEMEWLMKCLVECANGDEISLVYFNAQTLPYMEEIARGLVESLKESGKDVSVIVQSREQSCEIPIRREWIADPKGSIPIWVFRRFHRVGGKGYTAIIDGKLVEVQPGQRICQNQIGEFSVKQKAE